MRPMREEVLQAEHSEETSARARDGHRLSGTRLWREGFASKYGQTRESKNPCSLLGIGRVRVEAGSFVPNLAYLVILS